VGGADDFFTSLPDERQRGDARELSSVMARVSGESAAMWGSSIVGFGTFHYRYESGREGDTATIGFAPRKGKLVIYGVGAFPEYENLLELLGPHSTGRGCLYLRRLSDADPAVLEDILRKSWETRSQS
jgi:hypothetical protein